MNPIFSLPRGLCLPAPDIEALIQGRTIAALARKFLNRGEKFALYPAEFPALIKAWARCEICQILDNTQQLEILSQLTIWTPEALKEKLRQEQNIFVAYLRVYNLAEFKEISVNPDIKEKIGKFIGLSNVTASEAKPVLSDRIFAQRQRQLQNLEPPKHPELEELQSALSQITSKYPAVQQLDNEIKLFLGWSGETLTQSINADLDWIKTIAEVGNSSDGHKFEKLVRRGLLKLGFTGSGLNPDSTGGAGGLDFYCETPYPIVGECKATKSEKVPDGTAAQLVKLGYKHLQEKYNRCIKIIMAAGELTKDAELTANGNQMNVIRPETLQRLVELKAIHSGSIDLLKLKPCLEEKPFGEGADDKVNIYIDKIEQSIKLRSHIIQLVKNYLQNSGNKFIGVETLHGVYFGSNPPQPLETEEMHEILIELSSPLTGYLGREKGKDWKSDRFYFLRDLPTTTK
ncbi:DUF1802 family protein [Nodularia sp. UHCC 0506]|uniref:DUF1802 family protein n=1 Tax=Nodularia sp. UHCC 0506 TaxID=3110243 RepID=UPI002B201CA6|nr:DUF1802 family protein [Nodularia sp. UHCC 0506]MEA5513050.1 DUF1802 family protein [Nodularia sp. UHCC 0506]